VSGVGHSHGQLTQRAALLSVAVATILLVMKAGALWQTESVAMLGSLADTALDLVASLVTFWGVRLAATPADQEHRFGHGKAEALTSLFQVGLISVASTGIAYESFTRIGNPHLTKSADTGIVVSLVAIALSLGLIAYQKYVVARTGSLAIGTDALHYKSDFFLNLSVILALVLDHYLKIQGIDAIFGIAIALWLAWGAWHSASEAIGHLMDKEWSIEDRQRFIEVASRNPACRGIHDMRTRTSGSDRFVQFHIWVDPDMTVREAHDVMDTLEEELLREFPGVEILIHPDPDGHREGGGNPLRSLEASRVLEDEKPFKQA
jgi:ferrous-iron efflux pump FieF